MASPNEEKVPVIDFCKPELKPGTAQWETTKKDVFRAMQEYSCFEARYDKIPDETREAVFDALKQALPLKDKLIEYSSKPYHIYEGTYPHLPPILFYSTHSANLLLPASVETFASTFWPVDGNPHFCNVAKSFSKALVELDEMVKRMILESLGLKHYIDEFLELSSVADFRLTQYMKTAEGKESEKLESHADVSFLTIIKQEQVGLQILSKTGKWIELDVSPNSYVVLLGDSFMAWANGRLKPAYHKVVKDGDTDRHSIQLFSTPKPGHIVKAPEELVDDDYPSIFKPYDIAEFYKCMFSEAKYGFGLQHFIRP